jgi:hypothetical protein
MIGDGKGMVILKFGYNEFIVPVKAAAVFMEFIANGGAYKLESKWMTGADGKGNSIEIIEPAEIGIANLSPERVAMGKLNAETYKQYQEEKNKS